MIIVIDHSEDIITLLNDKLHLPFRALRVADGERAIELINKGGIELILLSLPTPARESLQTLKTLSEKAPITPVIFVGYSSDKDLILSAFRSGAKDFIEISTAHKQLPESIRRVIGQSVDKAPEGFYPGMQFDIFKLKVKGIFSFFWQWISKKPGRASPVLKGNVEKQVEYTVVHEIRESRAKNSENDWKKQTLKGEPKLKVYYLGQFRAILNERNIETWPGRKGRILFAYLAANHKKHIYRDILMERFWPDSSPSSARNSLNVALHHVRSGLKKVNPSFEHICFQDDYYFINPEMNIWLDTEEFYEYWKVAKNTEIKNGLEAAVDQYECALKSYKGAFMEEDLFDPWPASERENFKEIYIVILERLSKYYSLRENPSKAVRLCNAILKEDNCREDVYRRLMRCYYQMGQRSKALQQFKKCARVLEEELEVGQTPGTIELYEKMKGNAYHDENRKQEVHAF
ncbi:MAG: BTAD domain-containing putative transcriptional regulator [Nitrospinota bacterium]